MTVGWLCGILDKIQKRNSAELSGTKHLISVVVVVGVVLVIPVFVRMR